MYFNGSLKNIIEITINRIEKDYQKIQGLILSEADLEFLICCRLSYYFLRRMILRNDPNYQEFGARVNNLETLEWNKETMDRNIYGTPIHTQVPWYDDNHKLKIRPDITILDPSKLTILHAYDGGLRLPSKQYEFAGKAIIFELKFCRKKNGIDSKYLQNEIMKDFNKINDLFYRLQSEGHGDEIFCYFVIFNKTELVCNDFINFYERNKESSRHKIIYRTGKVRF